MKKRYDIDYTQHAIPAAMQDTGYVFFMYYQNDFFVLAREYPIVLCLN